MLAFLAAGYATTSTALSWFIFYISKYPDVQQKIKNELKENYLTPDMPLTQDLLDKLIYVECVTKETLRFTLIAAGIVREATSNDIIDGIQIKKRRCIFNCYSKFTQKSKILEN